MRPIDADVLEENLKGSCKDNENLGWAFVEFMRYVDNTPTLEANHTNMVLDKIRAEIEAEKIEGFAARNGGLEIALNIINRHKAESEDKNDL